MTSQKSWTYFSPGYVSSSSQLPCERIMMIRVVLSLHSFLALLTWQRTEPREQSAPASCCLRTASRK